MKFVFTPIGIVAGLLAGILGKKIFEQQRTPKPEAEVA